MKKVLVLFAGGLLLAGAALANQVTIDCGGATSTGSPPANDSLAPTNINCNTSSFVLPGGWQITDLILLYQDDYSSGLPVSNSFTFQWSSVGTVGADFNVNSAGAFPLYETVSGNSGSNSYNPIGLYLGEPGIWELGKDTTASTFGTYVDVASVLVGNVGSSGGCCLANNGSLTAEAYLLIDYSIINPIPEPMTMLLAGAGLLGLGLVASKRRKKA
jgi:hypothetical protein